jgi:hypothetical protein
VKVGKGMKEICSFIFKTIGLKKSRKLLSASSITCNIRLKMRRSHEIDNLSRNIPFENQALLLSSTIIQNLGDIENIFIIYRDCPCK